MPQLKEYDPPALALTPSDRGTDARLQAARRTGAFYNEAADLIKGGARSQVTAADDVTRSVSGVAGAVTEGVKIYEDYAGHKEISAFAAASAKKFSDLNDAWDKSVKGADPNDPSVAAKFRETVLEPELQSLKEAYSNTGISQRYAEQHVATMRQHFYQKTAADMATLAGQAVRVNIDQLSNSSSNAAFKAGDFHTTDYLLGQADTSVAAIVDSSNVKGALAAQVRGTMTEAMKEKIVKAGAIGAIAKSSDPERTAQEYADRYPQYLNGADAKALAANARQQIRADRADAAYQRHNAEIDKKNRSDSAEGEILKRVYSDDPKIMSQVSVKSIVNNPDLTNPTKEKLIRLVDREMKPESDAKISAQNSRDLFKRIYLPDGDPNKITDLAPINQARIDGQITKADHKDLREEVAQARTPEGEKLGKEREEFFKRYAASIDGAMDYGGHSALGSQKMYLFTQDVRRQEADLRKKGQDPHQLYDPRSPSFIGKPENIAKYHVSMSEAQKFETQMRGVRDGLPSATGTPPPKTPEVVITTKEQYDKLPSGAKFTSGGKKFEKP